MPSHNLVHIEQLSQAQQHPQAKVCSACQSTLTDIAATAYSVDSDPTVCSTCREHSLPLRTARGTYISHQSPLTSSPQSTPHILQNTRVALEISPQNHESAFDSPSRPASRTYLKNSKKPKPPVHPTSNQSSGIFQAQLATELSSVCHPSQPGDFLSKSSSPNPLTDITRLRIRSRPHHCLYAGAIFHGTQKSGRNSYDVTVTIVDVDFSSSFLCGYLRIRGLTEDWPELTTYFDAEIIGSRYGFLTKDWGATEQEDLVHWGRFPAFRHSRSELIRPFLKIPDSDCGAVFMRWKERFLVPDHRVQDINGASFSGFYYICVDFKPQFQPTNRHLALWCSSSPNDDGVLDVDLPVANLDVESPKLLTPSVNEPTPPRERYYNDVPVAIMTGFYYHPNSEPYQQLSLCHIPERSCSNFEFR